MQSYFIQWVSQGWGWEQFNSASKEKHQCDDLVNLVLTLYPGLGKFFDLIFEPGPNVAPQYKSTLSLHISVNSVDTLLIFPITILKPLNNWSQGYLLSPLL